jgi:energy-coupling factor transport system substrate-specific component
MTMMKISHRDRKLSAKLIMIPIALAYLALAFLALQRGNSLLIGMVLVLLSLIPFLMRFERRERKARELMLIAVMAAVATVSRIPFATLLPGFTPVTFVVIVSGVVFGAEAGWMVGATTALVSNIFLGQGPWTPWQMFAWGMAGYTAGLFAHRSAWRRGRLPLTLFGAAWGFLFGWIMNVTLALDQWMQTHSWEAVVGKYVTGLPFDIVHATANVFFILTFSPSWIALLERYRRKYGTLERLIPVEEGAISHEPTAVVK